VVVLKEIFSQEPIHDDFDAFSNLKTGESAENQPGTPLVVEHYTQHFAGRLEQAQWPPFIQKLIAITGDFLSHEGQQSSVTLEKAKTILDYAVGENELEESEIEALSARFDLFLHLRGQTGREIRRELRGAEVAVNYTLPGMVIPEYLFERDRLLGLMEAVLQGQKVDLKAYTTPPVSEALTRLAGSPEDLYERILHEQIVCRLQAARQEQWNNGIDPLQQPDLFLQRWLTPYEIPRELAQGLPRFLRENSLLGLPEYDLPLKVLEHFSAEDRNRFKAAIDRQMMRLSGKEASLNRSRLEKLKISLEQLGTRLPFSFEPNVATVLSARKTQIPEKGPLSKPITKWIELVGPLFRQNPKELGSAVLDTMGHIPEAVFRTGAFRKVPFQDLVQFHNGFLRAAQESRTEHDFKKQLCGMGSIFHEQRLLHVRSQLLKHIFLGGAAEILKNLDKSQVTIDVEGVRIDLPGPEVVEGSLHAHIPFAYVTEELCDHWLQGDWISPGNALEIRLQRAQGNHSPLEFKMLDQKKAKNFTRACDRHHHLRSFSFENALEYCIDKNRKNPSCPSLYHAEIAAFLNLSPHTSHIPLAMFNEKAHIPESVLDYFLSTQSENEEGSRIHKIMTVLQIAETLQRMISEEVTVEDGMHSLPPAISSDATARSSHQLSRTAKDAYDMRRTLLMDSRSYDVARILSRVLDHGIPPNSPEHEFMVFRGDFGKSSGGLRHHFLEILYKGRIVRLLISPDKQLTKSQRETFDALPKLDRADYERLEAFIMTYEHFRERIEAIQHAHLVTSFGAEYREKWLSTLNQYMLDLNAIVLTEFPQHYAETNEYYEAFWRSDHLSNDSITDFRIENYITHMKSLLKKYEKRLFSARNPKEVVDRLSVDIQREEVHFDAHFMDQFPADQLKDWSYDPELSTCGQKTWVVHTSTENIPYAMEAKAIRALELIPGRPLISFAGGCKNTDYQEGVETPSSKMAQKIIAVAHEFTANVAPPGTQSGFGSDMSKAFLEYSARHSHLSPDKRAECFAVSPGGETYYPGNPLLTKNPEGEPYAMIPFKTILTPFEAGWNWKGERRAEAPYFAHVEYMELIYQRLAAGAPRVLVVGNGGLFTIAESIAAMKNNVPIVLTKDSGRFTDFMIEVLEHFKELELLEGGSQDELDRQMLTILEQYVSPEYRSRLKKDFGEEIPVKNPEFRVYRDYFYQFLRLAKHKKIVISTIDDLDETMRDLLVKK